MSSQRLALILDFNYLMDSTGNWHPLLNTVLAIYVPTRLCCFSRCA